MELALGITLALLAVPLALTVLLGIPGHIITIAAAALLNLAYPGMFNWWTVGSAAAAVALAELIELAAGAAGAKLARASNRAAIAAIAGGFIGGVAGTFILPIPIVGTLVGAALGAAIAAVAFEATLLDKRDLKHLTRLGAATAATRIVALAIKGAIALLIALAIATDALL